MGNRVNVPLHFDVGLGGELPEILELRIDAERKEGVLVYTVVGRSATHEFAVANFAVARMAAQGIALWLEVLEGAHRLPRIQDTGARALRAATSLGTYRRARELLADMLRALGITFQQPRDGGLSLYLGSGNGYLQVPHSAVLHIALQLNACA